MRSGSRAPPRVHVIDAGNRRLQRATHEYSELGTTRLSLLGIPIRIECNDPGIAERLAVCYAFARNDDAPNGAIAPPTASLSVLEATVERRGSRWHVRVDGRATRSEEEPIATVRTLNHELLHGVMLRAPERCFVHAAVVTWQGRAIVIPGRSRAGKSTLALACVLAGAAFLSDELLAFDPARGTAGAFPRAIKIRDECVAYFPEIAGGFVGMGEGRFLRGEALGATAVGIEARVAAVVVPRWVCGDGLCFGRISRGKALLALTASSLNFGSHGARSLDALSGMVGAAECFSLDWNEPRAAARVILGAVAT